MYPDKKRCFKKFDKLTNEILWKILKNLLVQDFVPHILNCVETFCSFCKNLIYS